MLSYLFLYYAFVSNIRDLQKETETDRRWSPSTRIAFFATGVLLPILSIVLIPPFKDTTDWSNFFLFCSLLGSLVLFIQAFPRSVLERLLYNIVTSGLLVAMWGLPSHFGSDPTCYLFRGEFNVTCWTEAFRPTIRMFSTLGQPAWLAAYLATLLPITIALFFKSFTHARKEPNHALTICFLLLTILFYICLLFANTRAGFLGFWIANLVFWTCIVLSKVKGRRRWFILAAFVLNIALIIFEVVASSYLLFWFGSIILYLVILFAYTRRWLVPAIIIHVILFFLTFVIRTPFDEINRYTAQSLITTQSEKPSEHTASGQTTPPASASESNITDSGNIRVYVWKGAVEAWKANPIFGTGVETFAFAYYKHKPEGHNLTSEWDYLYNKAHNEYLNYLATTGAVGLGSYILFIGAFVFILFNSSIVQLFKKSTVSLLNSNQPIEHTNTHFTEPDFIITLGLFAGWISILITNFFGFSVVIINLFLFFIPAFALTLLRQLPQAKVFTFPRIDTSSKRDNHVSVSQWFGIIVLLLLALFMMYSLYTFWKADKSYALGSNLTKAGEYQQGYLLLLDAVRQQPNEPVFKDEFSYTSAQMAIALVNANEASSAAELAEQAVTMNQEVLVHHPNNIVFWKTRLRIFYMLSQLDARYLGLALKAAETAYTLAPTDAKIVYNLGVLYGQNENPQKAIELLEKAVKLKPDYQDAHYALGLFYHDLAVDENNRIVDDEMQTKAESSMQTILKMNPENEQVVKTLDEWKK